MKKKGIFLACCFFYLTSGIAFSQVKFGKAPLNPEYVKYFEEKKTGEHALLTRQGYGLGYIPSPLSFHFENASILKSRLKSAEALPTSYDLRTLNLVTPARNQYQWGNCWAFAAMGAIESNWLKFYADQENLSEKNMATCHGFSTKYGNGGNEVMAAAYLTRLAGPVLESQDGYLDSQTTCKTGIVPYKYVPETRWLPSDKDIIKRAIMDYGAVATSMYAGDDFDYYYNSKDYTFYYNGAESVDHGVLIVGWDDNKTVTGGKQSPGSTTGAWIVKNSWGTAWGENGFFYVAYKDSKFLNSCSYYPYRVDTRSINLLHMYDELGAVSSLGFNKPVGYGLTRFTASDSEFIFKVGTFVLGSGSVIDINIYGNKSADTLKNLIASLNNQVCEFPGYYTFDIPAKVKGDFYVQVKYTTPGLGYPIPAEMAITDTAGNAYASPQIQPMGYNWISSEGKSWQPLGDTVTDYQANLCIRAYADTSKSNVAFFTADKKEICLGSKVTFTQNSKGNISSYSWDFGEGASPKTSTDKGPVQVTYSTSGKKNIKLIVTGPAGADTSIRSNYVNAVSSLDVFLPYSSVELTKGKSTTLTAFGADDYTWSPATGLDTTKGSSVIASPADTVVYTVVGTEGNCSGEDQVTVNVNVAPVNDDMCNPIALSMGDNGPFTNRHATVEEKEPLPPETNCNTQKTWCSEGGLQNSVWFTFTPSSTDSFTFISRGMDTQLAIYEVDSCQGIKLGNYKMLAANDDYYSTAPYAAALIKVPLTKGKTYYLQMDGSGGGVEGDFYITAGLPPLAVTTLTAEKKKVEIYPNPTHGSFNIMLNVDQSTDVFVKVLNAGGQVVYSSLFKNESRNIIPVFLNQPRGLYIVQVNTNQQIYNFKLIIN